MNVEHGTRHSILCAWWNAMRDWSLYLNVNVAGVVMLLSFVDVLVDVLFI
jgi:hypothetical protein